VGTDREEVDPFDTLKTEPSGARPSEPPRLPPVLVQLLCAEDLRAPSARHWLEDCTEVRIHRARSPSARREGTTLTVGLKDPYASNQHLVARVTPAGFVVSDEGSTNGTFVNGIRVETCYLKNGDRIQGGETILEVVKVRSINQQLLSLNRVQRRNQLLRSGDARFLERVRRKPAFNLGWPVLSFLDQHLE